MTIFFFGEYNVLSIGKFIFSEHIRKHSKYESDNFQSRAGCVCQICETKKAVFVVCIVKPKWDLSVKALPMRFRTIQFTFHAASMPKRNQIFHSYSFHANRLHDLIVVLIHAPTNYFQQPSTLSKNKIVSIGKTTM